MVTPESWAVAGLKAVQSPAIRGCSGRLYRSCYLRCCHVVPTGWRGGRRFRMTAGSVLGFVLKLVMARAGPSLDTPTATAPGFSFPSGHALNSAVALLVFLLGILPALPGTPARVAAWVVGGLIVFITGFDRVALGVHYVIDVLAGRPHDPIEGVDPDEAGRLT
jgi:hypothetical protein